MLNELVVRDLGVIAELRLLLGEGLTALTGETGAGKTLLVEAIELLVGGRADPVLVRPGAAEAVVEGRFVANEDEVVVSRVVPASGRSRGYVDGRMAPVATLVETGARLVDLHGQHAHQTLLSPASQRAALDAHGRVDLQPLLEARRRLRAIDERLAGLGGDERARAREVDLLRFQLGELDAAAITDADEDARLAAEEERLGDALALREAAGAAHEALVGDGGAADALGTAIAALGGRGAVADLEQRLRALAAEVADAATDARDAAESFEDDPVRLDAVQARRQLLADLRRKYGDTLADVLAYADEARARLGQLEGHDAEASRLEAERAVAADDVAAAAAAVRRAREAAAEPLARAVEETLRTLAMPRARFEVVVGGADPGDAVEFLLAANPGEPALPLAKVASGGELARTMLAVRLALGRTADAGAPTLVFDEVDAGIGGEAAVAVGRALATLAADRQVLVVTHLPQVAAFADVQVRVEKVEVDGRTVARATTVDGDERVVELSRMLSGRPDSDTARDHAAELLALASEERVVR